MGKVLGSRKVAAAVMVLLIAAAVLFGSYRSLTGLRDRVDGAFLNGVENDGFSISADLLKRQNTAYNLVTIALHYYDEDETAVRATLDAWAALGAAQSVRDKAAADWELGRSVTALHDLLSRTELSEKDEKYPDRLYDDFRSGGDRIQRDGYNRLATEYNRTLERFPANFLSKLTGVKPAELFN